MADNRIIENLKFRRRVITILLNTGLISLVIFYLAFRRIYTNSLLEGPGLWMLAAFGFTCTLSLRFWVCPRCKSFLGKLASRACSSCGLSLISANQVNSGQLGTADSERVKAEFQKNVYELSVLHRRYEIIHKYSFRAAILISLLMISLSSMLTDQWFAWIVPAIILIVVSHYLSSAYYSYYLQKLWRCPNCKSILSLSSAFVPDANVSVCSTCGIGLV